MKRNPFLLIIILPLLLISCRKEESPLPKQKGILQLSIHSAVHVRELDRQLKSAPEIKDFLVSIFREDGSLVISYDSTTVRPDSLELEVGTYYVEAHSDNNLPAAFENPYY